MKTSDAAQLYRNLGRPVPRELADPREMRSKYGARKKEVDGVIFASTGEAEAYQLLRLQERAGAISNLELQPKFVLIEKSIVQKREVRYIADFRFVRDGKVIVVDFKGMETPVFKVKLAMLRQKYPEMNFERWTRETLRSLR